LPVERTNSTLHRGDAVEGFLLAIAMRSTGAIRVAAVRLRGVAIEPLAIAAEQTTK
jgi:hypothetical protein